jgi:hypothetical protein
MLDGWAPIRRGILDHIPRLNKRPGKKLCQPPSPFGLYTAIHLWADWRNGLCSKSIAKMAEGFNCSEVGIKRALRPLFREKFLIRLFPHRKSSLIWIPKFEIRRNKVIHRLHLQRFRDGSYMIYVNRPHRSNVTYVEAKTGQIRPMSGKNLIYVRSQSGKENKQLEGLTITFNNKKITKSPKRRTKNRKDDVVENPEELNRKIQKWAKDLKKKWKTAFKIPLTDDQLLRLTTGCAKSKKHPAYKPPFGLTTHQVMTAGVQEAGRIAEEIKKATGDEIRDPIAWVFDGLWNKRWLIGQAEERALLDKEKNQRQFKKREKHPQSVGDFMSLGDILLKAHSSALQTGGGSR